MCKLAVPSDWLRKDKLKLVLRLLLSMLKTKQNGKKRKEKKRKEKKRKEKKRKETKRKCNSLLFLDRSIEAVPSTLRFLAPSPLGIMSF
jgi:hypothetical protein